MKNAFPPQGNNFQNLVLLNPNYMILLGDSGIQDVRR